MYISKNINIDAKLVLNEISRRQSLSWNNGRINNANSFPNLMNLYKIINSGIPKEDFFYKGDLFRIHTQYSTVVETVNSDKETIIRRSFVDNSCTVLPITEYSEKLVAFSKSPYFTDSNIYYKVDPKDKIILIHVNTQGCYGIDVNKLQERFGITSRYSKEQEVLFPLCREFIVKEYMATPNRAKYYLRKYY